MFLKFLMSYSGVILIYPSLLVTRVYIVDKWVIRGNSDTLVGSALNEVQHISRATWHAHESVSLSSSASKVELGMIWNTPSISKNVRVWNSILVYMRKP